MEEFDETGVKNLENMIKDGNTGFSLDQPDFQQLRKDRMNRNKKILRAVDPAVANKIFPEKSVEKSEEEVAAICIQKHYRGYLSRKKYVDLLYEQFTRDEEQQFARIQQQIEEGELLIENHKLQVLFDDDCTTRRNKERNYRSKIITIQRHWRAHLKKQKQDKGTEKLTLSQNVVEEAENSETESAPGTQIMTPSTPEENTRNLESLPEDDKQQGFTNAEVTKLCVRRDLDTESDSVLSDCSEVVGPLRDLAENDVVIVKKEELEKNSFPFFPKAKKESFPLEQKLGESDVDFCRRKKKMNFLSLAQEFAELRKVDATAHAFDLHNLCIADPESRSDSVTDLEQNSSKFAITTPTEANMDLRIQNELLNNNSENDINRNSKAQEHFQDERVSNVFKNSISNLNQSPKKSFDSRQNDNTVNQSLDMKITLVENGVHDNCQSPKQLLNNSSEEWCHSRSDSSSDKAGDFDVYNIETALPSVDWNRVEQQLQIAAEEEEKRQLAQRNDREEIRRKLAMGTDDDFYCPERSYKKSNMQTRLQSGMNLQICFMNEPSGEEGSIARNSESDMSPSSSSKTTIEAELKVNTCETLFTPQSSEPPLESNKRPTEDNTVLDEDFSQRHSRLQNEAKLALAQAGTMAHMQLQLEKQRKKKSPIAEIVGVPCLGDGRRKRLSSRVFQDMNLAQLQVLVNDLHSQIESLNEELVKLLMERDELHMEQDSKLVDVEDLRRRAEEYAQRVDTKQKKENRK